MSITARAKQADPRARGSKQTDFAIETEISECSRVVWVFRVFVQDIFLPHSPKGKTSWFMMISWWCTIGRISKGIYLD
jgi:hypothetical protein